MQACLDQQRAGAAVGGAHQFEVADVLVGAEAKPVVGIAAADVGLAGLVVPVGEPGAQLGFGALDPHGAPFHRLARRHLHLFQRPVVELVEQTALPGVPDVRADGADVDVGQDQQHSQPLRRLDAVGEVNHRLPVVDVALEGGPAHQQVVEHQPGDRFGFPIVEAEPRRQLQGDVGALLRMIAAAPLGDVVQHHSKVERPPRADLAVLVYCVDMVHVVLHLRHHPAEVGDEAAEDAGVAQPLQGRLGQPLMGEHLDEQAVGFRVGAQRGVDQPQVLVDQPQRLRVDVDALALRLVEQPQHQHRVVGGLPPQCVVEQTEDLARLRVPRPPEIGRQLREAVDTFRKMH